METISSPLACLFDPPLEELDTFTRHGDLRYIESKKSDLNAREERAPMRAMAPLRWAIADEKALEKVYFWLFERVLEELGERYLGPAGIDLEEAVQEIYDTHGVEQAIPRQEKRPSQGVAYSRLGWCKC